MNKNNSGDKRKIICPMKDFFLQLLIYDKTKTFCTTLPCIAFPMDRSLPVTIINFLLSFFESI